MLVILKQLFCQAHGPAQVVSDRAINNLYFQHNPSANFEDYNIEMITTFGRLIQPWVEYGCFVIASQSFDGAIETGSPIFA